jgi:hypothetical protein
MSLLLDRNPETGAYELKHLELTVASYVSMTEAHPKSLRFAKDHCQKLFISAACLADTYVGFPKDSSATPVIFSCPEGPSAVQARAEEFRMIEGPFESEEVAKQAALKISGQLVR